MEKCNFCQRLLRHDDVGAYRQMGRHTTVVCLSPICLRKAIAQYESMFEWDYTLTEKGKVCIKKPLPEKE
mgnify:CR=1 FL=1